MRNHWYDLDGDNVIVATNAEWGSDGDCAEHVAGSEEAPLRCRPYNHSLWDFIGGAEMRSYFNALLFAVRAHGRSVSIPYRCDWGGRVRQFQARIEPRGEGHLRVWQIPVQVRKMPEVGLSDLTKVEKHCGICSSVLMEAQWVDILGVWSDAAMARLDRSESCVCPRCKAHAQRELARIGGAVADQPLAGGALLRV